MKENLLIKCENLYKEYDQNSLFYNSKKNTVKVIRGVDLSIKKGEIVGLVGESGCGKTTLGSMLVGLIKPTSGKIFYEGKDINLVKKKEKKVMLSELRVIFQDPYSSLDPRKKVYEIIYEGAGLGNFLFYKKTYREKMSKKISKLLEVVGLSEDIKGRYPHELSGGQRQRVAIARALVSSPKFIVADEPTASLDASVQAGVLNLFKSLQKEMDLTILFISHNFAVVEYISQEIAVMYLGKIVEIGSKNDVLNNPLHPYTKVLLSSIPNLSPKLKEILKGVTIKGDPPSSINLPIGCDFYSRCDFHEKICKIKKPDLNDINNNHYVSCHLFR